MSTSLKVPPITVDQYEGFEGYPGLKDELIYGAIYLSPQAKPLHQQVAKNVNRMLDEALRDQSFTAQQNTNIRFRDAASMPAPDVFVIAKEDWQKACQEDDYLSNPPVLVVEVLSPANRSKRVEMKVELYLGHGVEEVWLIHPKWRTFEVVNGAGRRMVEGVQVLPKPLLGRIEVEAVFLMVG